MRIQNVRIRIRHPSLRKDDKLACRVLFEGSKGYSEDVVKGKEHKYGQDSQHSYIQHVRRSLGPRSMIKHIVHYLSSS
ncbi:hypothetical protein D3C85_1065250 [compost metagenome]